MEAIKIQSFSIIRTGKILIYNDNDRTNKSLHISTRISTFGANIHKKRVEEKNIINVLYIVHLKKVSNQQK